MYCKSDRKVRF